MTDRYELIRAALEMGPTPGPWELKDGRTDTVENAQGYPVCTVHWHPDERYGHGVRAAYIAACDPDTIRALLEERDALREALTEVLRVNETDAGSDVKAWANAMLNAHAALEQEAGRE